VQPRRAASEARARRGAKGDHGTIWPGEAKGKHGEKAKEGEKREPSLDQRSAKNQKEGEGLLLIVWLLFCALLLLLSLLQQEAQKQGADQENQKEKESTNQEGSQKARAREREGRPWRRGREGEEKGGSSLPQGSEGEESFSSSMESLPRRGGSQSEASGRFWRSSLALLEPQTHTEAREARRRSGIEHPEIVGVAVDAEEASLPPLMGEAKLSRERLSFLDQEGNGKAEAMLDGIKSSSGSPWPVCSKGSSCVDACSS